MIADTTLIKKVNTNKILQTMRQVRSATKPQLAGLTGLSVVTIHSLVDPLVESGELLVEEESVTRGGRPAAVLRYNPNFSLSLILYTAESEHQDRAHAAVLDLHGDVIDREDLSLEDLSEDAFDAMIERMKARHPAIRVIGAGLPGQKIRGKMMAIDYPALNGKDFANHLRDRFKLPALVENDVNAAVLGYSVTNRCEEKDVVGLYIPERYPLGAGVCLQGRVLQGRDGFAGEAKYLPGSIDWQNPAAVSEDISEALRILILTFTCLFNPDRIVIYRENLTQERLEHVLADCRKHLDPTLLPDVVISNRFAEDFASGLARMTLSAHEQTREGRIS